MHQRQTDRVLAAAMLDDELLRKAVDRGVDEADAIRAIRLATGRDDAQFSRTRGVDHFLRAIMALQA